MDDRAFPRVMAAVLAMCCYALSAIAAAGFQPSLKVDSASRDLRQALESVSLVVAAKRDGVTNPQDILAAAQADYGRLVGALYDQGYFGPVVSIRVDGREAAELAPLTRLPSVSRVDLRVATGPLFRLGTAHVAPLAPATAVAEGFRAGMPAQTPVIRDAALAAVDGWRAVGHAKAEVVRQDIVADHAQGRLDVALRVAPGPRVRFGDLNISGRSAVRDERIRRIAGIGSGRVYDPKVLERAAARLRRVGSFSSVSLREAETLEDGDRMDIDLALVDAKPRRFGFGAELKSTEGVTLSGFWMHRNLLGGAERLRVEGEIAGLGGETGGLDYHLRARLTRPSTFNTDTDLFVLAEVEQLDEPLYLSRQAGVELGFSRYYSEELNADAAVAYRFSDVEDGLGARQFSHLALPLGVTWDRRDDVLNPADGTYLRTEAMPFLGLGASSASGGRVYADARAYRGFGAENGVVLAGRLQFGSVIGPSIAQTPPDLLFLSGGSGTVRGHSYQSLSILTGPVETGGRSFLGFSGEIRTQVSEKFSAVAFYDAGYIGANSWIDGTGGWHSGAGLGIRYQTGIGPIRLDVATPVTGASTGGVQVYVGIGQAF